MVTEAQLTAHWPQEDHVLERGDWVEWHDWPDGNKSHTGIVISDGVCHCGKMLSLPHVKILRRTENGMPSTLHRTPNRLRWIGRREDPSPDRSVSPGSCHRA